MNYIFNDDFILRFEFFGGLLYSPMNSDIYIVKNEDAVFLDCIKCGYARDDAIKIVNKYFNFEYVPNIDDMLENEIIHEKTEKISSTILNIETEIEKYKKILNEAKKRNYLSSPIEVSIYPSSFCQLNCKFCYFSTKRNNYKNFISINKWLKLIDELKNNSVIYLSILGGEPTLYPHIDEILQYVDKIKFKTTITTNGLDIKKSTFDIICKSEYITPTISIQSLDEYNLKYMGVSSAKIIKTIKEFIKNDKIPRLNSVIYKQSEKEIYEMIDFCADLGIEEYALNIYMPLGNDLKSNHDFNYYKELDYKVQEYISKKKYNDLHVSMQGCLLYSAYYNECENPVNSEFDKIIYGCEAGQTKVEIMPDGTMLPCTAFKLDDFIYDNVFKVPFEYAWGNSKCLKALRNYKIKDDKCVKCKYSNFCNGGCPAYNIRKNKSLVEKGDERCQVVL